MRRPFEELAATTIQTYRSRARKLWLKVQSDQATQFDRLELAELEALLGCGVAKFPLRDGHGSIGRRPS